MSTRSVLTSEEKLVYKQALIDYMNKHVKKTTPNDNKLLGFLPGDRYGWQMYLGNALYNHKVLEVITYLFLQEVHEKIGHYNFQLAGREWSACPLLSAIPVATKFLIDVDINSFMVKKERKTYGMRQFTEGVPQPNVPVLIIDDALNSTISFDHCRKVIESELKLPVLPFIFAPFNKYQTGDAGKDVNYDHILGKNYRAMWGITMEELNRAQPITY
jgi:hypothetical protein